MTPAASSDLQPPRVGLTLLVVCGETLSQNAQTTSTQCGGGTGRYTDSERLGPGCDLEYREGLHPRLPVRSGEMVPQVPLVSGSISRQSPLMLGVRIDAVCRNEEQGSRIRFKRLHYTSCPYNEVASVNVYNGT